MLETRVTTAIYSAPLLLAIETVLGGQHLEAVGGLEYRLAVLRDQHRTGERVAGGEPVESGREPCEIHVRQHPKPQQAKGVLRKQAMTEFGVGKRGFDRAYDMAVRSTGATAYSTPGRKPKQQIESPE